MAQPKTRGRKSSKNALLVVGLLLVGGVAAIGTIMMVGDMKLPFFNKTVEARDKKAEDHAGKIPVPLSAKTITAYTQVTMESVWDTKGQKPKVAFLDPKQSEEMGFLTKVDDIVGRVMARDKEPNYAFKETDFLPKGTRPGPTAGLEPNTRGMWINVDKISGLRGLKRNDRFDLMAVKYAGAKSRNVSREAGINPALVAEQNEQGMWDASNRVLVQNAKIVVPFPLPGAAPAARGKEEVFIQVSDLEADPLTDALAVDAQIICFSRSSRPGADESPLPTPEPPAPVESIEVISGGKSSVHVVPPRTPSPDESSALDDGESIPETSLSSPKKDATLRDQ
jgi:hypothetical protein